jgi:molybdopterin-containing oxidoreductase family iron-sulfur binding subunit
MKEKKPTGLAYWRSLDQLENTPEFKEFLYREFPQGASEFDNSWSRRSFITLMGASVALAGLAGCRRPIDKIVPYVTQPEEITPGVPNFYATTLPHGQNALGLLVKSNNGHPTKVEGNPEHRSTLGSSSVLMQSEILNLYDPDRSRIPTKSGAVSSWDDFVTFWRERLTFFQANQGQGLAFLIEEFHSPTLYRLAENIKKALPLATWVVYEPLSNENSYEGIRVATGKNLQPIYNLDRAEVILSLDADFIAHDVDSVRLARQFADGRRVMAQTDHMNRLYVVESNYSVTGATADHRLRIQSRQVGDFLIALGRELQSIGLGLPAFSGLVSTGSYDGKWLRGLARDLVRTRGKSAVMTGMHQPTSVHALAFSLNEALGNIGTTLTLVEPQDDYRAANSALKTLTSQMAAGTVDTLVMLGGNPVYNAPVDLQFAAALPKVKNSIHLAPHVDETSRLSTWHLPKSHILESWGDARSIDGTLSVIQPLIEPLFATQSTFEVMNLLATGTKVKGYDIVRETWQGAIPALGFEKGWRKVLHDGLLQNSAHAMVAPSVDATAVRSFVIANPLPSGSADTNNLEILFTESNVYDGRLANNGWLQELPDPITRLTWDNAALISNKTAQALGLKNGDMVRLSFKGQELELPIWINPGQADNSVTLRLGYGRTAAGRVAENVGFDTYKLRTMDAFGFGLGATMSSVGRTHKLASVQDHGSMEGRPILREATLDQYQATGEFYPEMLPHPPLLPMWDPHTYDTGYQWGMSIDLTACTGCNACVVACQAENNIPIVGKEQVIRGREMHWMRLDRYYKGEVEEPEVSHQPMLCQHCENAPCENVCPVAATVHDKEGLNVMVYNRCIGTRYCSNNCPYKVRRFNFYNYTNELPETVKMAQNPDVTVRMRGVMEKCTFCIQRINAGKLAAKLQDRQVKDGEIITACQQACPSKAIVFGNINDPSSQVANLKKGNRDYSVLEELNTKPRTTYLAKIRNVNPEIGAAVVSEDAHATHKG